jgi:hypothetical protein
LIQVQETENLLYEKLPEHFPSVSSFVRPVEYLGKHIAKEMPKCPLKFVKNMIAHQREVHEHALNVIRKYPMGKSPDAVEAGNLSFILKGEDVVMREEEEISSSHHNNIFRSRYDAFRRLHKGKYSRDELKEKWQLYKKNHDKKSRLVQVFCVEAESEIRMARGTDATIRGRKRLYEMGSRIRNDFGIFDDVRVWATARHTPSLHGAESFVHGLMRVFPMPTDLSRIRMRHEYTKKNRALVYHCNLALSDFGIRALTRTVPILTTRGPLERSVALNGLSGNLGVRALLSSIIEQIRKFDNGPGLCLNEKNVPLDRNQLIGYVGSIDAIRGLYKALKIDMSTNTSAEFLSFEVLESKATQKYRRVRVRSGDNTATTMTHGTLCRIRDAL